MADTKIQHKQHVNIWRWIFGALFGVLVAWALVKAFITQDEAPTTASSESSTQSAPISDTAPIVTPPLQNTATLPSEVSDFINFANANSPQAGQEFAYVIEGGRELIGAINTIIEKSYPGDELLAKKRDILRQASESLQPNTVVADQASATRNLLLAATDALSAIQQKSAPDLSSQVSQLHQTANTIKVDQLLIEQIPQVKQYFQQITDILPAVARATNAPTS